MKAKILSLLTVAAAALGLSDMAGAAYAYKAISIYEQFDAKLAPYQVNSNLVKVNGFDDQGRVLGRYGTSSGAEAFITGAGGVGVQFVYASNYGANFMWSAAINSSGQILLTQPSGNF